MFSWISLNRTNSTWHTAISLKYAQVRYEVKVQTSYDCNKFANLQNSTRISVNSDTAASKVSFVKTSTLSSSLYDVAPQRQIKPRKTKKYECMITRNKCFTPAIRLTRHYKQTVNTTTKQTWQTQNVYFLPQMPTSQRVELLLVISVTWLLKPSFHPTQGSSKALKSFLTHLTQE